MAFGRSRQAGSSPLTRGKPRPILAPWIGIGLIPAHAGKTGRTADGRASRRAHPRSRGENLLFDNVGKDIPGSSPLTRGKRSDCLLLDEAQRLIPAHAGKTCRCLGHLACPRAHPRSRGENRTGRFTTVSRRGSSPLTRGKPASGVWSHRRDRLIPAHAGKTATPPTAWLCPWAHPRSRGENEMRFRPGWLVWGSSPLTRGKRRPPALLAASLGLIPAHAGKTHRRPRDRLRPGAHPRSRGEN